MAGFRRVSKKVHKFCISAVPLRAVRSDPIVQNLKGFWMFNLCIAVWRINDLMISNVSWIKAVKAPWRNPTQQHTPSVNPLPVFYKVMVQNFHCFHINLYLTKNFFIGLLFWHIGHFTITLTIA